jgi:hypothetical protein
LRSKEEFDPGLINMGSDKEKASSDANRSHEDYPVDMPADPDAHLSPEEKAEVVSRSNLSPQGHRDVKSPRTILTQKADMGTCFRNAGWSGGWTGC